MTATTTSNAAQRGHRKVRKVTSLTLAKRMIREFPATCSTFEAARAELRRVQGLDLDEAIYRRARKQVRDQCAREKKAREKKQAAPKPGNGVEAKPTTTTTVPTTATWLVSRDVPGGISVSKVEVPSGPGPQRGPALLGHFDELIMSARLPILSLAASMGGLGALRRAVDELIAGLAPEIERKETD
jgi:hypothetical protein